MLSYKKKYYYTQNPDHCPYCEGKGIRATSITRETTEVHVKMVCDTCENEWTDVFNLFAVFENPVDPSSQENLTRSIHGTD